MDVSPSNVMYGDIQYDISDFLSNMEEDLSNGSTSIFRNDSFREGFENIFNMKIEDVDDVEERIQENPNGENRDEKIQLYQELVSTIRGFLDTYFGITFDEGTLGVIDMNKLYMVYRTIFVNYIKFLSQCVAGRAKCEKIEKITKEVIEQTIMDENVFTTDNIRKWLFICDPGNIEYEYVFGEYSPDEEDDDPTTDNEIGLTEVCIDNFAFRSRICKDLNDKANTDDFMEVIMSKAKSLLKNI